MAMPPSLIEILRKTEGFFTQAGLENPRLEAEWLLAAVLGCRRLDLYLKFDQPMEKPLLDRLRPMVARRARREPLQYILGETAFGDLILATDHRALIPRPETELLVEKLLREGAARTPASIVDLGTGTGAIALALAKAFPEARVTGVDASPDALALARENADRNGMKDRVRWIASDWFSDVGEATFDWIISNPPYLTEAEWESAAPEVQRHEPKAALVAEDEGRGDLEKIIDQAFDRLETPGLLALETGIAQHAALDTCATTRGYSITESQEDDTGRPRFFWARRSG